MKHVRDTAKVLPVDANVIRNIMDQGASTVMNVKKMKIVVFKVNVSIYMEPLCPNDNAIVISDGLDQIARKVSSFLFQFDIIIFFKRLLIFFKQDLFSVFFKSFGDLKIIPWENVLFLSSSFVKQTICLIWLNVIVNIFFF